MPQDKKGHIFRFHKGHNNNIYDWKASDRIVSADVKDIMDKTNILTSSAGSSIPTPIARMYLFKTAFEIMAGQVKDNKIDAQSIYAGLVSDTLDLLELLYKSGADSERFRYKKWVFDSTYDKDELVKFFGPQHGHRLLAESFIQAASQSPFNNKIEITLIYFKELADEILVGGTSPFTFVFTSPNFNRNRREKGIREIDGLTANDKLFETTYRQLHERDKSFIKYVENLIKSPQINESFNGFAEYVTNIKKRFEKAFNGVPAKLQDIKFNDAALSVSNIRIQQISEDEYKSAINLHSDFKIELPADSHYQEALKPLFLNSNMDMDGQYTSPSNHWSNKTSISALAYPATTIEEIKNRELPGVRGFKYPFLSKFDIFEKSLVMLPGYSLNDEKFVTLTADQNFILPIKPLFFYFFPVGKISDYIKIHKLFKEGVKEAEIVVHVTIPIYGPTKDRRIIEFQQTYKEKPDPNSQEDEGKLPFTYYKGTLGIFPFTRTSETRLKYINNYSVASYEKTNDGDPLESIKFLKDTGIDEIDAPPVMRSDYPDASTKTTYYQVKESFDVIQLTFKKNHTSHNGIIIPKFNEVTSGIAKYVYAIDFGTSNTHIEYAEVDENGKAKDTKPFEVWEKNMLMTMLNKPTVVKEQDGAVTHNDYSNFGSEVDSVKIIALREFVPFQIGAHRTATTKFPFRTAIFESRGFKESRKPRLFTDANIGFNIERDAVVHNQDYQTDIKWQLESNLNDTLKQNRVKLFFRQLLLMIRTHALLNTHPTSDLNKLIIAMSYPVSMDSNLKADLVKIFDGEMRDVFNIDKQDIDTRSLKVNESIAPYYFLLKKNANIQHDIYCNIDVGGGTSDIVLVDKVNGELHCYCNSVKFAGKQLWGSVSDDYNPNDNGFILALSRLLQRDQGDAYGNLNKLIDGKNHRTQDIISHLFNDQSYRFKEIFKYNELKVPLLLHYAALLYYVAKSCSLKQISLPKTLSFSGKGSEYISILFRTDEHLKGFTKRALSVFSGLPANPEFAIQRHTDPKVITAKGSAIYGADPMKESKQDIFDSQNAATSADGELSIKPYNDIYFGFRDASMEQGEKTYSFFQEPGEAYENVLLNCVDFLDSFFGSPDLVNGSEKSLGINNLSRYKSFFIKPDGDFNVLKNGVLRNSYKLVLENLSKEGRMSTKVNDSPFFFAFNTSLIELSKYIADEAIKNQKL